MENQDRQAFNPFLPSWEYIPDGEPHIFGDRVYLYGSHDRFNASIFCVNDYVCWSAPVNDLSDWRDEGVIYRKKQDPKNRLGFRLLFAPDAVQGADGRYYLYYAYDFMGIIGVAVCDTPSGSYQFYGHVHYKDGTLWGRRKGDQFPFDPAVLSDSDGRFYIYSGFYTRTPSIITGFRKLKHDGGTVAEIEKDMLTLKSEPRVIFPIEGNGSFPNHEFFEASSIRKDGDKYLFVYSSRHNHELCYAESSFPDRDFSFKGTLVSQGDLFIGGNEDESKAVNYLGNTHGGLLNTGDDWYIFYHRQTNRHSYSRQACAEKLVRNEDGTFRQAEVTSCGLNGKPLKGEGRYYARIACNLWSKHGTARYDKGNPRRQLKEHPYFTQSGRDGDLSSVQYIANMRDGAVAGFKYFDIDSLCSITVEVKGYGDGAMEISTFYDFSCICCSIHIHCSGNDHIFAEGNVRIDSGTTPLYFRYTGKGAIDFIAFELRKSETEL